ncbi:MAG: hypothetical protein U0163_08090 [Gemmatimonadaceae bacterium]
MRVRLACSVALLGAVAALAAPLVGQQQPPRRWTSLTGAAGAPASVVAACRAGRVGLELQRSTAGGDRLAVESYVMQEGMAEIVVFARGILPIDVHAPGVLLGSSVGLVSSCGRRAVVDHGCWRVLRSVDCGRQPKSAVATTLGADLTMPESRFAPVIGVRFVYLSQPLANVQSLLAPAPGSVSGRP